MRPNPTSVFFDRRWITTVTRFGASALILILLSSSLIGTRRLAFRDVSHFYTPLYNYVAQRCHDEWLPLWNPLDQTGIPLIGETTTAVFYPIRYAIFALPISTSVAMAWYVAIHLIIAGFSATMFARAMGVSRRAAIVASIIYPMSGSVWFFYTNPPYLVSAAWLPIVMATLLSHRRTLSTSSVTIAAAAMAMMILGGDPQTALHAMIVATLVVIWRFARARMPATRFAVLVATPLLAAMMSAPQLASSIAWSRQSNRVAERAETSRFEPPIVGAKQHQAYQFSLPPWRVCEIVTPSAFGSLLPGYRRVSQLIPGDGRIWTPTLYVGMLAAIALLDRLFQIRRRAMDAPLGIVILSLALASGHFGLVWWIQASTGTLADLNSAAGGPYWWLYEFLPGYDSFRYPSKWLTFFSLGVSTISAQWLDQARWRSCRPALVTLAALVAIGFTVVAYGQYRLQADFNAHDLPSDPFWGPLDVAGAFREIRMSLVHSLIALSAIGAVIHLAVTRRWQKRTVLTSLLLVTLIDLSIVASGITYTVDVASEQQVIDGISQSRPTHVQRWMRTQSGRGWPTVWQETSSGNRLAEVEASQRIAWFGRWHLSDRAAMFNNMTSIESRAMTEFWKNSRSQAVDPRNQFWDATRQSLQIDGIAHTSEEAIVATEQSMTLVETRFTSVELIEPPDQQPRSLNAQQTDFELRLTEPTSIVRPVLQDGNWIAEYRGDENSPWQMIAVTPWKGLLQRVQLPAGNWRLRFRYKPWWLPMTLIVAAITWSITWSIVLTWWLAGRAFSNRQLRQRRRLDLQ